MCCQELLLRMSISRSSETSHLLISGVFAYALNILLLVQHKYDLQNRLSPSGHSS